MDDLTPAALKSGLDYMGLSAVWFANRCEVTKRTVFRWFDGVSPIPPAAAEEFTNVWGDTLDAAVKIAEQASSSKLLLTYRTDAEFWKATGSDEFPASWHRALVARISDNGLDMRIEYAK